MNKQHVTLTVDVGLPKIFKLKYPGKMSSMVNEFMRRMVAVDGQGNFEPSRDEIEQQIFEQERDYEESLHKLTILRTQLEEKKKLDEQRELEEAHIRTQLAKKQIEWMKRNGQL